MRRIILVGTILLFISCSSPLNLSDNSEELRTVKIDFSDFSIGESTKWFSSETKSEIISFDIVKSFGEDILSQFIVGYRNQIGNYKYVDNDEVADITFIVKRIDVKRRWFTFNFLKPGPMYLMIIEADVKTAENVSTIITKKSLTNMATVVFPNDNVKWMSKNEKGDTVNQIKTFQVGLRRLYQNLFFDAFNISLQL
jgi:hypothetical protein